MTARRLLVLDDDAAVASTAEFIARGQGMDVRVATAADEFFELLTDWSPHCVLLDLVMPTMDGMEVLRSLAELRCSAAIIVTSGMGAKVLEVAQASGQARGLVIRGILPKPFRPATLRALLQDLPDVDPGSATAGRAPAAPEEFSPEDIMAALDSDQILLHFQPEIEVATRRPVGCEALVRWQHPVHGMVPPIRFVPVAERSDLIDALTWRVVALGLDWLAGVGGNLQLAINLSANSLHDVHLADRMHQQCSATGVAPSRIVLELTETSAMRNPADAMHTLTRLRIMGFTLALDDFGTGYSSMVQLARLPFSWIKIDRSFVGSMQGSEESRKIVESTINLGKGLGLTSVAEGVEDESALQLLQELGCDMAQGYHIARPMAGADAARWLAEHAVPC